MIDDMKAFAKLNNIKLDTPEKIYAFTIFFKCYMMGNDKVFAWYNYDTNLDIIDALFDYLTTFYNKTSWTHDNMMNCKFIMDNNIFYWYRYTQDLDITGIKYDYIF